MAQFTESAQRAGRYNRCSKRGLGRVERGVYLFWRSLQIAEPAPLPPTVQGVAYVFSWTGRDAAGNLVRPGAYLYRIDLGADAGGDTTLRTVAVAY